MPTIERFVFNSTVTAVNEKIDIVKGTKDNNGNKVLEEKSDGWYITVSGMQFYVGDKKPDACVGDGVRLSLDVTRRSVPVEF